MTTLYLCYQSIREPLTRTQVVAYLEGLSAGGIGVVLLTFEPASLSPGEALTIRRELLSLGIRWHWLRYHKRPTLPATFFDIVAGVARGVQLRLRYGVTVVHARAHVPGVMAWALQRITGVRFIFDVRGLMAEEYVDGGVWPADGMLFSMVKRAERRLLAAADGVVVLTNALAVQFRERYPREIAGIPMAVIPTCIDRRATQSALPDFPAESSPILAYVGKLGGWYWDEALVDFFSAFRRYAPECQLRVLTQSDSAPLRELLAKRALDGSATISRVAPSSLDAQLRSCTAGVNLLRRTRSAVATSPTKIGDYLAAGLPVVSSAGVGDVEALLLEQTGGPVGIIVRDHSNAGLSAAAEALVHLLADPQVRDRCRRVAAAELDLVTVGWPRYRALYSQVGATA